MLCRRFQEGHRPLQDEPGRGRVSYRGECVGRLRHVSTAQTLPSLWTLSRAVAGLCENSFGSPH
eukprot:143112-Chlamydomonas_euryale.AAC.2